jgi:hypothetical protein
MKVRAISTSKTFTSLFLSVALVLASTLIYIPQKSIALSGADFKPGLIIDDDKFYNSNSMSTSLIQEFLNSKVPVCDTNGTKPYGGTTRAAYSASRGYPSPYTCLKDYTQNIPSVTNGGSDLCKNSITGGTKSAAQIIKDVSVACGINPQVLLVMLQKEMSLITDDWPWTSQYDKAMGYACPDSGPNNSANCDSAFFGFFNQVYNAAKAFRRYEANPNSYNYRAGRNNFILYNPNTACGGTNVFIQNQATASLYIYTPYQPNASALNNLYGTGDSCGAYGNRNFWRLFNDWFGPTTGYACGAKSINTIKTEVVYGKISQNVDHPNFIIYSGTSTNCIEAHGWNTSMTSWKHHIASNKSAIPVPDSEIMYADLNGDGIDEPILVGYRRTGSKMVEFHVWNTNMKSWQLHRASNQPAIDPANSKITFADINGDGRDQAILVGLRKTGSKRVEFHVWNQGMNSWQSHTASNQPAIDPANSTVVFADVNGDGRDEAVLVGLRGTGSKLVEFHVWNQGMNSWQSNSTSNQPAIDPANSKITFADINGDGRDQAILVGLRKTGSNRVEFHVWNQGMNSWQSHTASNQTAL